MKKTDVILLLGILILGIILRLYKINQPLADWHSWRQSDTSAVSRVYEQDGIDVLHPRYYDISSAQTGIENPEGYRFVEFPLFNLVHIDIYRTQKLIGTPLNFEGSGRLVSVIASMFSLVFIYLMGRSVMGSWGGLIASFFYATLPFNVYYSRTILPEQLAVAFMLASIWVFMRALNTKSFYNYLISAILFSLSILVKPFTIFFAGVFLYLVFKDVSFKSAIISKKYWVYLLVALLPFTVWRLWMIQYPEGIPHMKWAFNGDGIRFRPAFWRWIFGERIGVLILGVGGFLPFMLGIFQELNRKNNKVIITMSGCVALFVAVFATANVRHDYYQILLLPAIVLLLASGCIRLYRQTEFNRVSSLVILLCAIGLMYFMSWNEVKGYYQINNYSIVKAGEYVDRVTPVESKVIAPYNKDTAFLYQTKRFGWPYVDGSIEDLIEKGATHYVSVTYDPVTVDIMNRFTVIEQNTEFVLVEL